MDSDAQSLCSQNVLLLYAQTVEGYGKNLTDLKGTSQRAQLTHIPGGEVHHNLWEDN